MDHIAEKTLEKARYKNRLHSANLISDIVEIVESACDTQTVLIWANIPLSNATGNLLFSMVCDSDQDDGIPSNEVAIDRDEIFAHHPNLTMIIVDVPGCDLNSGSVVSYVIGVKASEKIPEATKLTLSTSISFLIENFAYFMKSYMRDQIVNCAIDSNDLSSFLDRLIRRIFSVFPNPGASSIFYFDRATESLILGSTTGIPFRTTHGLKKSDIRYFPESESFTAQCYATNRLIYEHALDGGPLRPNTYGEDVISVVNRTYVPIRAKFSPDRQEKHFEPIGVMRIVNANTPIGCRPLTLLQAYMLEYIAEMVLVLGQKYLRVHSVLHDQERATHGYVTDLLTIKLASSTIKKCVTLIRSGSRLNDTETLTQEIEHRAHSISAVQENMSHQLITVSQNNESSYQQSHETDQALCLTPYKSVFLKILEAKKGIAQCYNRDDLLISSAGVRWFDDNFQAIPALAITVGQLYLVVRNIVENAIKYSPSSPTPRLDITWAQSGSDVTFFFRDFGIGIPAKERVMIGREGFRGNQARRIQLRGNGLGLATSMEIMATIKGQLSYEPPADEEGGSLFKLVIPKAH